MPSLREFQATGERSFVSDPVDPKKIDWKDSHTLAAYKMGKSSGNGKKNPFHKKNDPEGQLHTCWNMGNRGDKIPEAKVFSILRLYSCWRYCAKDDKKSTSSTV